MNEEQFTSLTMRLEEYARLYPARYRLRVALLAALGYSYLAFVTVVLLLMIALLLLSTRVNVIILKQIS